MQIVIHILTDNFSYCFKLHFTAGFKVSPDIVDYRAVNLVNKYNNQSI